MNSDGSGQGERGRERERDRERQRERERELGRLRGLRSDITLKKKESQRN